MAWSKVFCCAGRSCPPTVGAWHPSCCVSDMTNLLLPFALSVTAGVLIRSEPQWAAGCIILALAASPRRCGLLCCGVALGWIWVPVVPAPMGPGQPVLVRVSGTVLTDGLLRVEHGGVRRGEKLRLLIRKRLPPGDRIEVQGLLTRVREARNPGQYDRRAHDARRGVHYAVRVGSVRLISSGGTSVWRVRQALASVLADRYRQPARGLVTALLLGDRTSLGRRERDRLVDTGLIHFLAVSGLHVGLVAWLLFRVISCVIDRPGIVCCLTLAGALAYAALSGMRPPVVRAAAMAFYCLGARWCGREVRSDGALGWTVLVSLAWDPLTIFTIGFQLSFAAVLSIFSLGGILGRGNRLGSSFWVSFAAWLGSAPLVGLYFHRLTPLGALLSPFVLPPVALVLVLGALELAVGHLIPLASCVGWLAESLLRSISWFAELRIGQWSTPGCPSWSIGTFHAAQLWVLLSGRWKRSVLCVGLVVLVLGFARTTGPLRIELLDVGPGLAAVVHLPDGATLLYDCGSRFRGGRARNAILPALRSRGVSRIDWLVLSHPDSQHCNGVLTLARAMPIHRVVLGERFARARPWLVRALSRRVSRLEIVGAGIHRRSSGATSLTVLVPPQTGGSADEASLLLRVGWAGRSALLTGDAEGPALRRLTSVVGRVDLLQLPSPARSGGGLAQLVDRTGPRIVCGSGKRGCVDASVRRMLHARGIKLWETGTSGAVTVQLSASGEIRARGHLSGR